MIDIGSVINGKYRLVRLVGDGGMGSVYEGLHLVLGTRVAIKLLHPDLARRTGLVERFLQEARVAAQIRSPHVVQVTDVDRTPDGHAFIVMELLEGEPLSGVLDRQRRLPVTTACEYALQVLEALEAAHALGVIHRDLKPENVFVTFAVGRPVLKLIDFGIAKARRTDPQAKSLTVAGVVMGTAEYMAPEQARSADKVDARSDLYAVGVMLYEMIAGVRPVSGDDARVIALKVERGEVTPLVQNVPDVPREVAGLVHRAMAARPELRFPNATEMRLALERAATAKRATAGMGAVAVPVAAPGAQPVSLGPTPPVGEMTATGTLKNVSAQQVLGAAAGRGGTAPVPIAASPSPVGTAASTPVGTDPSNGPSTQRAAPLATALAAPLPGAAGHGAMAPPGHAGAPPAPPTRGRPRALVLVLTLLAFVLAGGVAFMLVQNGVLSFGGDTTPTSPPAPPHLADEAGAPSSAPAVSTALPSAVPSLSQTKPPPAPGPAPHPGPARDSGVEPSPGPVPPFVLPSNLPPIPSLFPLPSGFPTTIPSIFPPWPVPTPAPTPKSAGSTI